MATIKTTAYSCVTWQHSDGRETYHVQRNYKNGKRKLIGRTYKTWQGAVGMVRHRNALHADRHGTHIIERRITK